MHPPRKQTRTNLGPVLLRGLAFYRLLDRWSAGSLLVPHRESGPLLRLRGVAGATRARGGRGYPSIFLSLASSSLIRRCSEFTREAAIRRMCSCSRSNGLAR